MASQTLVEAGHLSREAAKTQLSLDSSSTSLEDTGAITSVNEFMQTMILMARADWDERTAEVCEGGEI